MSFINAISHETNKTARTEKGALSYQSTLDSVLDFFSKSGALRGKTNDALDYFIKAYAQDSALADKALFYCRDVREGQGEREIFKHILKWIATRYADEFKPNVKLIPEYGRWDDLYVLIDTPLQDEALKIMKDQFNEDLKILEEDGNDSSQGPSDLSTEQPGSIRPKSISLLGKWLKSENTSSKESRRLAKITRKYFKMNPKEYRQALSKLRAKIEVVEKLMSETKWDNIIYEHVPSKAMKNYIKAFKKHDPDRYAEYIKSVQAGTAKINASTLYPYDIAHQFICNLDKSHIENEVELNELWKNLPDYFEGEHANKNVMCVVDVSGSMYSSKCITPIDVAISLGLYMAERNKGPFKNYFITFSSDPELVKIKGNDLFSKIKFMSRANWGGSTDILKTFKLILDVGKKYSLKQEDMPEKLFIISDMQFDNAIDSDPNKSTFEIIDDMFKESGYKRPDLIFWNVNARDDSPITKDEQGTYLVSGMSPTILKNTLNMKAMTALDFMLEVLNGDRYKDIV